MQTPDDLMALAITAFEQWRKTRVHRVLKTPEILQQQAVELLTHFSSSQIMKTLNISGTNFKQWTKQHKHNLAEFITLPPIEQPSSAPLSLELAFGDACHLRLYGEISPAQLSAITQSITASSAALRTIS